MEKSEILLETFDDIDQRLAELEAEVREETALELVDLLPKTSAIARELLNAYSLFDDKPMPETDDLLELFKAFVKGDPSLNAVRDNLRELVYYQNCLVMDRADALPEKPSRIAVRTTRHIYLYLRSRCEQEQRFG